MQPLQAGPTLYRASKVRQATLAMYKWQALVKVCGILVSPTPVSTFLVPVTSQLN